MASGQTWRLKRYGRFVPGSNVTGGNSWKIFEATCSEPIVFTIVEAGYMMVLQGQECLDTIPLLCGPGSLKMHQKSDNLIFRYTVKGESRMMRMQFDGSSRAEAINECSSAVEKLMQYVPVTTQDDAPLHPNQPPSEAPAPATQTCQDKAERVELEVLQGSVSIRHLTQHFLGETTVILPEIYRHSCLTPDDLEPILRVFLLDPSFPSFVEKVEEGLKKMLQE
ncbi:meiotic recombination protein REC114 [Parambassis ranga]|uniref:Meiotic recombination protein REC114 n=1 Tax=Parambassis ranga TaxID=210632 RepID=A0A6P7HQX6_9TELE|nr:meiotic recombination protein REC114 [Parambassis ranga]